MATIDSLLVRIDASTELLRQELAKANTSVGQFANQTDAKLSGIAGTFSKLGTTVRTALGAFGLAFGGQALIGFTRGAIESADAIGEVAKAADFGVERFQRLQLVFQKAGVDAGEFESAMRTLNTRLGQYLTTGTGAAADAIKRLGLAQRIASGEIRGAEDLFDAIVQKLSNVSSAAERAALASQFFGREAGAKLQDALSQGAGALASAEAAITNVLSAETVSNADKLADAWERISSAVLKTIQTDAINTVARVGQIAGIDELQPKRNDILRSQIQMDEATLGRLRSGNSTVQGTQAEDAIKRVEARLRSAKAELDRFNLEWGEGPFAPSNKPAEATPTGKPSDGLDFITLRQSRTEPLRQVDQIPGMAEFFSDKDPSSGKLKQVEGAMKSLSEATATARDRQREFSDSVAATFESRGMQALLEGKPRDAIRGFAKDIGELIIRMLVLKPLAEKLSAILSNIGKGGESKKGGDKFGLVGSILGFAGGGRPPMGRMSVVGESGPELFVPDVPGRILSNAQSAAVAGGGGVSLTVQQHIEAGTPPQWDAQFVIAGRAAAQAAYEAVMSRMGGRR